MKKVLFRSVLLIVLLAIVFVLQACSGSGSWSLPAAADNSSPTVVITAPLAGSVSDEGILVTFTGTANDPEDGALTGTALVWTSDRDGQIGTGLTFDITTLSKGVHVITLSATDQSGATGMASITITVRTPWMDAQWGYRQQITISSTMAPSDQADFPALIKITDNTNPLFANALANGDDILFTDMDGVNQLDHEIELYSPAGTEELDAWVRIPVLSSTADTVIYMYYGNAGAANQENIYAVWGNDFQMVQHLNESPADGVAGHIDSSDVYPPEKTVPYNFMARNFNDGGGGTTDAIGKIGGADLFAGDNDYLEEDGFDSVFFVDLWRPNFTDPTDPNASWTFSAWIKTPTNGRTVYSEAKSGAPVSLLYIQILGSGQFHSRGHNNSWTSTHSVTSIATGLDNDAWHYVVMTSDNGNLDMYIDGVHDQNYIYTPIGNIQSQFSTIGAARRYWSGSFKIGNYWDGIIDEVRVSRAKRSAEWLQTEYNNQDDPGNFLMFGAEEIY